VYTFLIVAVLFAIGGIIELCIALIPGAQNKADQTSVQGVAEAAAVDLKTMEVRIVWRVALPNGNAMRTNEILPLVSNTGGKYWIDPQKPDVLGPNPWPDQAKNTEAVVVFFLFGSITAAFSLYLRHILKQQEVAQAPTLTPV
ncbi:Hypothetical protein POVN_LOCUS200, partial [uncultured virus]